MGLFSRKQPAPKEVPVTRPIPVEIVTNKNARKEVIEDAKKAQAQLNKLLVENGFTIKILVAAGAGSHSNKRRVR